MVRRWTSLVWSAVLPALMSSLPGGGEEAAQPVTPTVLERLRAATVFICVYEPQSNRLHASGSGFLASPRGDIVAPLHVITGPGQLQVILNSGQPGERRVNATIAESDRANDLALLKADLTDAPHLKVGDSARMRETSAVISAGFPLGVELKTGELGPAPSFRTGTITSLRRTRYGGVVWLEVSGGAEPGSSGSPVVDENGVLVGVVLQRHGMGTVLARPSRHLVSFAGKRLNLAEQDRTALRQWQEDPLEQAQILVEAGQFFRARAALQPLLDRADGSARVLNLLAGTEEGLGNLDAAITLYERLQREHAQEAGAGYWPSRVRQLAAYRGDGNPRNNLAISSPLQREVAVIDAGQGRVLEVLQSLPLYPYVNLRSDGHYAYSSSGTGLTAVDLVLPQEAMHLRREYRELGTPDWVSASRDGSVVVMGVSPEDEAAPSSAVVVLRGPELREAAIYKLSAFFPRGYVAPDGETAYVFRVIGTHAVRQREKVSGRDVQMTSQIPDVEIRRLDLATGRLTAFIAKTDALTWVAFPAGVPVAYAQRWDRRVMRIDLTNGRLAPVEARELRETHDITAGPGPGEVLFGGRSLIVWDAAKGRVIRRYPLPFEAYQVGATADGTYLFAADGPRDRVALIQRESGRVTEIPLRAGATTTATPPLKVPEPAQLDHRLGATGLTMAADRIRAR